METNKPKVFISYSHDSEKHKQWVDELAAMLTQENIHVFYDGYDLYAGCDLINYMETSVSKADKVILILTPNYKSKAEKREAGVGYETRIITSDIYNNQNKTKFIPIVMADSKVCIPNFLFGTFYIDMQDSNKFSQNFKKLIRSIFNKAEHDRPSVPNANNTENEIQYEYPIDDLKAYEEYRGIIPTIELYKYGISKDVVTAQKNRELLKVIKLKLLLARICRQQNKINDVLALEKDIRKTLDFLSPKELDSAEKLISEYKMNFSTTII